MRILVTGATGFIGKALVKELIKDNHEIICFVRKTSKIDFLEHAGIQTIVGNITNAYSVDEVFRKIRPEKVFHCAAAVMQKNKELLDKANITGTFNVCDACLKYSVKRLIYLSSVSVISGNPSVPLKDGLPYSATNNYGTSKIEAERIAIDFRNKGLKTAIIRPCIVYGEEEPHALDKILTLMSRRRIPVLNVAGMDSKLNIVYIDNVVEILLLASEKDEALEGTFVVADRDIITLRKFLEFVYHELGISRFPIIPGWIVRLGMLVPPFRKIIDRICKDRVYDITRAESVLGYDPKVTTQEGLKRTVKWWLAK
ncbi:MAG: NAD(P)-dependent oxidoreductase [Candidatus Omnitrophota bacterium]